ncbi:hypothetical protein [Paenibacillus silvisoli]|uniref:hypothetical protein n=1 Tax=Paenibacillus silvisoli TaxID=3110539 RepID=UPI002804CDDE|nr:hypothetical protein [Paenibacillus silvisoli]
MRNTAIRWLAAGMALLLLGGCTGEPLRNVEVQPPTRGLLHYLQQDRMTNVSDRGYKVTIAAEQGAKIGQDAELTLQVVDPSGMPVEQFTEDMTKLMHLIVVSSDLSSFSHVHPMHEGKGLFKTKVSFPHGGRFLLISEFMPNEEDLTVVKQWVTVDGEEPAREQLVPAKSLETAVDGVNVTLSMMPGLSEVKAGEMAMLQFTLRDAETGEAVKLEPYLGTSGHCVILDESATQYLHVHAATEMSTGSSVMFHTEFPKAGVYKLWGQFQYKGKVLVVPFVVEVKG